MFLTVGHGCGRFNHRLPKVTQGNGALPGVTNTLKAVFAFLAVFRSKRVIFRKKVNLKKCRSLLFAVDREESNSLSSFLVDFYEKLPRYVTGSNKTLGTL